MSHKKYLTLSIFFHAVLVLILIYSSYVKDSPMQVFEVSIVNSVSPVGMNDTGFSSIHQGKNTIVNKLIEDISLGEVEKEKPVQDPETDLPPSEINPGSPNREGHSEFMGEARGSGHIPRGTPYEIKRWRSSVQSLVESSIQNPVEKKNTCLQTTCLLMVSRTGELLKQQLIKSSGNHLFDNQVQVSLGKVSHLPPPPMVLIAGAESIDVTMTFTYPMDAKN
jgi:hypothetical protein